MLGLWEMCVWDAIGRLCKFKLELSFRGWRHGGENHHFTKQFILPYKLALVRRPYLRNSHSKIRAVFFFGVAPCSLASRDCTAHFWDPYCMGNCMPISGNSHVLADLRQVRTGHPNQPCTREFTNHSWGLRSPRFKLESL